MLKPCLKSYTEIKKLNKLENSAVYSNCGFFTIRTLMKKSIVFLMSLCLVGSVAAEGNSDLQTKVDHKVYLKGMPKGEGRYIRVDVMENNKTKWGAYFCAGDHDIAYSYGYSTSISKEPVHKDYFIKFSICQDETLAQCQEFAIDKYLTFRNAKGDLENDISEASIDISTVKDAFQACEPAPYPEMDEAVKQSLHLNDRRFSQVG